MARNKENILGNHDESNVRPSNSRRAPMLNHWAMEKVVVVYSFTWDTRSFIAFSIFIDQINLIVKLVQLCYLIKLLLYHSTVMLPILVQVLLSRSQYTTVIETSSPPSTLTQLVKPFNRKQYDKLQHYRVLENASTVLNVEKSLCEERR